MPLTEAGLVYARPVASGSWRRTLHGYLSLARISNSPTVVSNVLAGAALGGALQPNGTVALLAVALVLFYTAGMFLNDICDYAIDLRQRPERPLPMGTVTRSAAATTTVVLFVAGSLLLWLAGPRPFLAGLVLIAVIVVYDVWHKANPLSPLVMAATRLLVYVIAYLAFTPRVSAALLICGGLLALYVLGLTYIAKKETAPSFRNYWPAALLFLPVVYFGSVVVMGGSLLLLPLLAVFAAWVAYSILFVYRTTGRSIGGAIGRLIAGISLLDALVLAMTGAAAGIGLALVAFGTTQFFQRYIKGT
jgi:4-hydroxybenzoate polyprenyltransferase